MRWIIVVALIVTIGLSDAKEGFHIPRDLSYLHLSPLQKEHIRELLQSHRAILHQLHEKEEETEKELAKMFLQKRFNKRAFLEKNLALKRAIAQSEANFFAQIHAILTPKQRRLFIKYLEEWEIE